MKDVAQAPALFAATYDQLSRAAFSALGCAMLARRGVTDECALQQIDRAVAQIRAVHDGMAGLFDALRAEIGPDETLASAERRAKAAALGAFFLLTDEDGAAEGAQVFDCLEAAAKEAAHSGGEESRVLRVEGGSVEDVTEAARNCAFENYDEDLREAPDFIRAGSIWGDLMSEASVNQLG